MNKKCYVVLVDDHIISSSCLVNRVFLTMESANNYIDEMNKWFRGLDSLLERYHPYYIEESVLEGD